MTDEVTVILDNGEAYSSHCVVFVRVPAKDAERTAEALRVCMNADWNTRSHVVGIAQNVEWRDPDAVMTLDALDYPVVAFEDWAFDEYDDADEKARAAEWFAAWSWLENLGAKMR